MFLWYPSSLLTSVFLGATIASLDRGVYAVGWCWLGCTVATLFLTLQLAGEAASS